MVSEYCTFNNNLPALCWYRYRPEKSGDDLFNDSLRMLLSWCSSLHARYYAVVVTLYSTIYSLMWTLEIEVNAAVTDTSSPFLFSILTWGTFISIEASSWQAKLLPFSRFYLYSSHSNAMLFLPCRGPPKPLARTLRSFPRQKHSWILRLASILLRIQINSLMIWVSIDA